MATKIAVAGRVADAVRAARVDRPLSDVVPSLDLRKRQRIL